MDHICCTTCDFLDETVIGWMKSILDERTFHHRNCGRGSKPCPTENAGFDWCHFCCKPRWPSTWAVYGKGGPVRGGGGERPKNLEAKNDNNHDHHDHHDHDHDHRSWPTFGQTDFGQTQFWCFTVLAKFSNVVVVWCCYCVVCCCAQPLKTLNLAWKSGRGPCSGFDVVVVVVDMVVANLDFPRPPSGQPLHWFHTTARELQTCTFQGTCASPREDPRERQKQRNGGGSAKCWAPHPSGPHPSGPHPSGPHLVWPLGFHPSGSLLGGAHRGGATMGKTPKHQNWPKSVWPQSVNTKIGHSRFGQSQSI